MRVDLLRFSKFSSWCFETMKVNFFFFPFSFFLNYEAKFVKLVRIFPISAMKLLGSIAGDLDMALYFKCKFS